ncbi:MAG: hypothetical protein LQ351_001715 [Letrouitia transgressa]|nr:MAG: hypothetical protein LQ351_001715 [Letrouitia transgressa]
MRYIPYSVRFKLCHAVEPVVAAITPEAVSDEQLHVVQGFPNHLDLGVITSSTTNPLHHAVQPSALVQDVFPRALPYSHLKWSEFYRKGVSFISVNFNSPDVSQVTLGENPAKKCLEAYLRDDEAHSVLKQSYFEGTDVFLVTGYISVQDLEIDYHKWARGTNQKTDIRMKIRTSESQQNDAEQDNASQNEIPQVMLVFAQLEKVFYKFGKGPASAHLRKKRKWYCISRFNDNSGPEKVEVWLRNI